MGVNLDRATGGETISDFRGLGQRAPIAALTLAIFLFSLTGIPPFAGFIGKYLLFAALLSGGGVWAVVLAVIGVLNTAVSLFYYAKVVKAMYFDEVEAQARLPVPALYNGILSGLALLVFVIGLYWSPLARWAASAFA